MRGEPLLLVLGPFHRLPLRDGHDLQERHRELQGHGLQLLHAVGRMLDLPKRVRNLRGELLLHHDDDVLRLQDERMRRSGPLRHLALHRLDQQPTDVLRGQTTEDGRLRRSVKGGGEWVAF